MNPVTHAEYRLGPEWWSLLRTEFAKDYMYKIYDFLGDESKVKTIYPHGDLLYKAFEVCDYNQVKVVILGQDPYHNGVAHGLAFSDVTHKGTPSLRKIREAVGKECYKQGETYQFEYNLTRWANQGVLLLNTILSVEKGKPLSHQGIGWEQFTGEVIKLLNLKTSPIVYLLWGKNAREYKNMISNELHLVLEAEHPVASSYAGREWNNGECFTKCNDFLIAHGVEPIIW